MCIDYFVPLSSKELSRRKIEEYLRYSKIINWGRQNPSRFAERFLGTKLMDYQTWAFLESWHRRYVLWLECRAAGKTTKAAIFLMTRMLLIPNYITYISTNSEKQSLEVFSKMEKLATNNIPTFKGLKEIFLRETDKGRAENGFKSDGTVKLFNGSEVVVLTGNTVTELGKRGAVFYDETKWQTKEQMTTTEHFANVDQSFATATEEYDEEYQWFDPTQMPLQLLYASSAGDVTYPFFEKYQMFSKKMFLGDPNYFACDFNANTVMNYSTINGNKVKSHLTQEQIDKDMEEDQDMADRELFNRFQKGSGQNAVVRMETITQNSTVRIPLLYNPGKLKFIFCFDPARAYDNSILTVFQVIEDADVGYKLQIENMISMVDRESDKKTPLPMNQQIEIIRNLMLKYKGVKSAEWENIELYVDAGAGGGGKSSVADRLMEDWEDEHGGKHRGVIDPIHKNYETARKNYPNALPIMHLIEPVSHKKIMYSALEEMTRLNLINFTDYDKNKDYLLLKNGKEELETYMLSDNEKEALTQINMGISEMSYMCRYETPNGGVQYELARDKRNKVGDDRVDTIALGAFALAEKRRSDLLSPKNTSINPVAIQFRKPKLRSM